MSLKQVRNAILILGGVLLSLFIAVVALNSWDETLNPKAAELLREDYTLSPEAAEGFKYLLGIGAPEGEDPMALGREIFQEIGEVRAGRIETPKTRARVHHGESTSNECGSGYYCGPEKLAAGKAELEKYTEKNRIGLERFEKLLSFGSFGRPFATPLGYYVQIFDLLRGSQALQLKTSRLLAAGKTKEAMEAIGKLDRFFVASLANTHPLLDTMVAVVIVKNNRAYIRAASAAVPAFSKIQESLGVLPEYSKISENVLRAELGFGALALDVVKNAGAAEVFSIGDGNGGGPLAGMTNILARVSLQKTATINLHHTMLVEAIGSACVSDATKCEVKERDRGLHLSYIINPIGKFIVELFSLQTETKFEKLHDNLKEIAAPKT